MMISLSTFAFTSLIHSRHVDHASREIAGLIEQAHAFAVSNRQPVWLGFASMEAGVLVSVHTETTSPAGELQFAPLTGSKMLTRVSLARTPGTGEKTVNILDVSGDFQDTLSVLPLGRVGTGSHPLDHIFRIGAGGDIQIAPHNMPRRLEIAVRRNDGRGDTGESRALMVDGLMGSIQWVDHHAD